MLPFWNLFIFTNLCLCLYLFLFTYHLLKPIPQPNQPSASSINQSFHWQFINHQSIDLSCYLSVCLYDCLFSLSVGLSVCEPVDLTVSPSVCRSFSSSVVRSLCLSVSLSLCLSVSLSLSLSPVAARFRDFQPEWMNIASCRIDRSIPNWFHKPDVFIWWMEKKVETVENIWW